MICGDAGKVLGICCCVLLKLNREFPSLSTISALEQIILRIPMILTRLLNIFNTLEVVHGSPPSFKKKERRQGSKESSTDCGITSRGSRTWISNLTDKGTSVFRVDVQQNNHEFHCAWFSVPDQRKFNINGSRRTVDDAMQCNTLSHEMDLKYLYKPETRGIPS